MTSNFFSSIAYLGKDFVAQTADQQLAECELPRVVRSRCMAAFANPELERDAAKQRLYLLAAIGERKLIWPRVVYWKGLFDQLGGERPYLWTRGIYPVERRRSQQRPAAGPMRLALKTETPLTTPIDRKPAQERRSSAEIRSEERHQIALVGLLQHYVQFVCYAERDRRQIGNLGTGAMLTLSRDAVENRIERMWLDGLVPNKPMWRAEPPFFPGHRATLRPRFEQSKDAVAARRSARRNVWVVS